MRGSDTPRPLDLCFCALRWRAVGESLLSQGVAGASVMLDESNVYNIIPTGRIVAFETFFNLGMFFARNRFRHHGKVPH